MTMQHATTPHRWLLVKVHDGTYKVFATYNGGYFEEERWRMNSGIEEVTERKDCWEIKGYSGSLYRCWKEAYGTTGYGENILSGFQLMTKDLTVLSEKEALEYLTTKTSTTC